MTDSMLISKHYTYHVLQRIVKIPSSEEAPSLQGPCYHDHDICDAYYKARNAFINICDMNENVMPSQSKFEVDSSIGIRAEYFTWLTCEVKRLEDSLVEKLKQMKLKRILKKANMENVLPVSSRDVVNIPLGNNALNFKEFLCYVGVSVLNMPPKYRGTLLFLYVSYLISYQAKSLCAPEYSVLSIGEAFVAFFPEIGHITKFMLCYFLTLMLVFPVEPAGVQIFFLLLLISAPLSYFPELARKAFASGVDVACGSFKLPLFWFTTLGAFGLCLLCGLLTLLMVYFSWRFIYEGKPRVKEIEVSVDALSEILDA